MVHHPPARAFVCMHGARPSAQASIVHSTLRVDQWPLLRPKDTHMGRLCPHSDGYTCFPAGRGFWSPSIQGMAWKGRHEHTSWALWTSHPKRSGVARRQGAQGPGPGTTLILGARYSHSPTVDNPNNPNWRCVCHDHHCIERNSYCHPAI